MPSPSPKPLLLLALTWSAAGATYPPSAEDFPNPERGFYVQTAYNPERGQTRPLDAAWLRRARDNGMSLLRMYWVLSDFRDHPLSPAMLDRVRADFATARACGVKIIGRFAYNFGPTGAPDAALDRVLGHLDQLRPVLRENADVLAFLEAGFIGTWGEWHDSTNGLMSHTREIVAKLLDVLPPDRMLALRYPRLKTDLYGAEPLRPEEAFTASPKARTGAHNDCFLASRTDWGTWSKNAAAEKAFYHQDNLFVPQGGETCNFKEDAQPFIGCENALGELAFQRFNTLNSGYQQEVLDFWTRSGCMPEIRRRLGYRFRLVESSAQVEGSQLRVSVTVRNDGFANLYNPRPVLLVLRDRATGRMESVRIATDPRRWMPGESTTFGVTANLPPGDYDVLLHLPDAAPELRARPEYAVRFANPDVWEPATGMNRLGETATIGKARNSAQYPRFLSNSYVGIQLGYIDYPFSNAQVQPGFHAQSIWIPHLAVGVVLFGHEFNKYFSAQISDMRPAQWMEYRNVNGLQDQHSVWMNVAGLTGKARLPVTRRLSIYGDGGLGIVTRKGFTSNQVAVVTDASYETLIFGGGLDYRVNRNWSLLAGLTAAPGRSVDKQPRTLFYSGGFTYTMRRLPSEVAAEDSNGAAIWPKNRFQVGYITDAFGFGANNFVSKDVRIFWTGSVQVTNGISMNFLRNVFHTRRFFAFDWGAGVSSWKSRKNGERFYTTSVYPVFRFPLVRTAPLEFYFSYSLAGPAVITRTTIDDEQTGKRFTFQDYMSAGVFLGRKRRVTGEVRIAHYSNGNLFPQNAGVTIPLGFYLGSTF